MLNLKNRLTRKSLIKDIFKTGRVRKRPLFSIYYKKISPPPQLAVVVSKKVSPKAVKRNIIKRRFRAAFIKSTGEISNNLKVVVVVRKEVLGKSYKDIEESFQGALRGI